MKKLFSLILTLALLAGLASTAKAIFPLTTDNYRTTPAGRTGLEMGYSSYQYASGEKRELRFTIKRGILGNLELGAELPASLTTPSGLQDATLSAKINLLQFSRTEGLSLKFIDKLANGSASQGTGTGYPNFGAGAILTKGLGLLTVHLNAGYMVVGVPQGAPAANYSYYSLAMETILFGEQGELFTEISSDTSLPAPLNFQLGTRFWLGDFTQFIIGYGKGLSDSGYQSVLRVGFTTEI